MESISSEARGRARPAVWLGALALAAVLAPPSGAVPSFTKEEGVRLTSAVVQGTAGAYPTLRAYYIRGSSLVYSAVTADGQTFVEEAGVRLSSLTVPSLDIAVSSITGLSLLPLDAGGFRMLYSVIGTTGAFRIYSATSADGLAWANATGTAVDIDGGTTFAGHPSLIELGSGDWRLYFIRNSVAGNDPAQRQVFTALSTDEGASWSTGPAVVAARAGEVAATQRTDGLVRLYYTAPLTGETTHTTVLSALSSTTDGTSFSLESGVRLSTPTATGSVSHPLVIRSTDTGSFRWRLYYNFAPGSVQASTSNVHSATTFAPDPTALSPSTVFQDDAAASFSVSGEIFSTGVSAVLRKTGESDIPGTGLVWTDDQNLTVTFDTQAKALGFWDLVLTNGNGVSATLSGVLNIDFKGGSVVLTDNLLRPRTGLRTRVDVNVFNPGRASVRLYSQAGRHVATLLDADVPIGTTTVFWDGRNSGGSVVASGVYFLKATGPKLDEVTKIVVIK